MRLTEESRKSLLNTAVKYHEQMKENPEAVQYLEGRGITAATAKRFGLGFVGKAEGPEDESFTGRISIPYMTSSLKGYSCIGFKFRNMTGDKPKYLYRKGLIPKLFNPSALLKDTDYICITEGEIDAVSAEQAGLPTVGIPGATQWEPWYSRLFNGYSKVYFLQDNDAAGAAMAEHWASEIANVQVVVMEKDVNADLVNHGEEYLKEMIRGD